MLSGRGRLRSFVRTLYSGLALFALIHLTMLAGVATYAVAAGRLDRQKLQRIVSIMRGQELEPAMPAAVVSAPPGPPKASADTSEDMIKETLEKEQIERLERERALAELRQLNIMWDRRALTLQRQQQEHQQQVAAFEARQEQRRQQAQSESHKKTVTTISSMDPKKARDYLMNTTPTDAVRILLELPDRKRKGILESCKTPDQTTWRDQMLNSMLRQPAPRSASRTG